MARGRHAGHAGHSGHTAAAPVEPTITPDMVGAEHASHAAGLLSALPDGQLVGLAATLVHTIGYLLVTGLVAVVVYEKLGLRLLRRVWFNLDLLWGIALILTALVTPFL